MPAERTATRDVQHYMSAHMMHDIVAGLCSAGKQGSSNVLDQREHQRAGAQGSLACAARNASARISTTRRGSVQLESLRCEL